MASTPSSIGEQGREFVQRRVAGFGLLAGGLFAVFWLYRLLQIFVVGPDGSPWVPGEIDASMLYHLGAAGCFLLVWAATSIRPLPLVVVRAIESTGLIASAFLMVLLGAELPLGARPDYILLLALSAALTSRAIYVPSSWQRSLTLATVIGVVVLAALYRMFTDMDVAAWAHLQPQMSNFTPQAAAQNIVLMAGVWWLVTTAITAAASNVIFGLRRDVRAAMKLGQYHLESKLGEGGMGIVFLAQHALLRRPTAVKLLLVEKAGERSIERFEREVMLMSKLRHPNTITVFDYGRSPTGVFYYAMEFVDGANLGDIVDATGPLEPTRAVQVLAQVVAAMVEAHGVGLIHRDIKPANIMLFLPHRHGGIAECVKVLDFGLVKELAALDDITQANTITGTPQYMAPESIRNPELVGARSDVYSIGCLLFFLVTGEHLFNGDSAMDVCAKHLYEPPDTMADRLGAPVDERLETILKHCIAKEPGDRPADARALEELLDANRTAEEFTPHDALEWWEEYGHLFERELAPADRSLSIDLARARPTSVGDT